MVTVEEVQNEADEVIDEVHKPVLEEHPEWDGFIVAKRWRNMRAEERQKQGLDLLIATHCVAHRGLDNAYKLKMGWFF